MNPEWVFIYPMASFDLTGAIRASIAAARSAYNDAAAADTIPNGIAQAELLEVVRELRAKYSQLVQTPDYVSGLFDENGDEVPIGDSNFEHATERDALYSRSPHAAPRFCEWVALGDNLSISRSLGAGESSSRVSIRQGLHSIIAVDAEVVSEGEILEVTFDAQPQRQNVSRLTVSRQDTNGRKELVHMMHSDEYEIQFLVQLCRPFLASPV